MRSSNIPGGLYWLPILIGMLGYCTLNRGFAYIGIYPVFFAEMCLFWYAATIKHHRTGRKFLATPAGFNWLLLFLYSSVLFVVSAYRDPGESIRNSIIWFYTIFFYLGFVFGGAIVRRRDEEKLFRWLLLCAKCVVVYYLLFPFRVELQGMTAWLQSGTVSLFGYYSTLHATALGLVFLFLFTGQSRFGTLAFVVGLAFIVAISQARASMLAVVLMGAYVIGSGHVEARARLGYAMIAAVSLGVLYSFSGLTFEGQRGVVTLDFFERAVSSIFFGSDMDSLAGSRTDRLLWWKDVLSRTFENKDTAAFGIGLDTILVNRATSAEGIIRYPHNSFVSVFGFLGSVGALLYIPLIGQVYLKVRKALRVGSSDVLLRWYPVFLIGFLVSAFFSTVLESPFHSFFFWVLSGIVYRISMGRIAEHESSLRLIR